MLLFCVCYDAIFMLHAYMYRARKRKSKEYACSVLCAEHAKGKRFYMLGELLLLQETFMKECLRKYGMI